MIAMRVEDARKKKKNKKRNRYIYRSLILAVLLVAVIYALVMNVNKGYPERHVPHISE